MPDQRARPEVSVTIRSYAPGDYSSCLEMYGEFRRFHQNLQDTPDILYGAIANEFDDIVSGLEGKGALWVAASGPKLVGFVTARLAGDGRAEIPHLFVRTSYRRLRVGQRLVDAAVEWARAEGQTGLRAIAVIENADALQFFTRIGFRRTRPDSLELNREW